MKPNNFYQRYATIQTLWILVINIVALTITMSEEPINRKDDVEQDIRDTADHVEEGLDETGDTIKAGTKAMGNKIKDPNVDLGTEYREKKLKEEVKDI